MITRVIVSLLVIIFSMTLARSSAGVDITSANMDTSVVASCMVDITNINFGIYSGDLINNVEGNIRVRCAAGIAYNIAIDAGGNALGRRRRMSGGGGYMMNYGIFKNSGRNEKWGDSDYDNTYSYAPSLGDSSNGDWQNHPVYGLLTGGQSYYVGAYSDMVNVTIYY